MLVTHNFFVSIAFESSISRTTKLPATTLMDGLRSATQREEQHSRLDPSPHVLFHVEDQEEQSISRGIHERKTIETCRDNVQAGSGEEACKASQ